MPVPVGGFPIPVESLDKKLEIDMAVPRGGSLSVPARPPMWRVVPTAPRTDTTSSSRHGRSSWREPLRAGPAPDVAGNAHRTADRHHRQSPALKKVSIELKI